MVDIVFTRVINKFLVIIHMDMVSIPKVFISVIFDYFSFNHLWNLLKLGQNPCWKILLLVSMVKSIWNFKRKTHKFHKNKSPFKYSNYVPMGHKNFEEKKKSFQKDFWKQGLILTFQKFITTIWLWFHKITFHN